EGNGHSDGGTGIVAVSGCHPCQGRAGGRARPRSSGRIQRFDERGFLTMVFSFGRRMLTETDLRLLGKFAYNFGFKGVLSVEKYRRRLTRGESFPPFLFTSVISGCQLRCQGCWVDVADESKHISLEDMNRLIGDAKKHGNSYFGILGGEPF